MTNPGNAVGTNGAYDGRTSVNAFNDVLGIFNGRGVVQGWGLQPSSGMTIAVGGDGSTRDVAVAEDNIGNKTTVNNISEQPVLVTIGAAPATDSRIDLVVAYVENPPQGTSTVTDNYGACGLITVQGTPANNPTLPTDSDIRTAITADGGAGTVAYYVVLGRVIVTAGTTDIDATMLANGPRAAVRSQNIDYTPQNITGLTPSSYVNSSSGNYQVVATRIGNIVDVKASMPMAANVGANATASLVSGLPAPALSLATSIPCIIGDSTATLLSLGSTGNILFYGAHVAVSTGNTVRTHFTYIAAY